MIITIDTEAVAKEIVSLGRWTKEDFADNDAPMGWSNSLVDAVPEYEEAVYRDVVKMLGDENDH